MKNTKQVKRIPIISWELIISGERGDKAQLVAKDYKGKCYSFFSEDRINDGIAPLVTVEVDSYQLPKKK